MAALTGRQVLVTGGGSGIGRAACVLLAAEGAVVWVTDIQAGAAQDTAQHIVQAGGQASAHTLDVTQPEAIASCFAQVQQAGQGLHALVNSAGIGAPFAPTHQVALADWQRVLAVNLTGTWLCMQQALSIMLQQKSGCIVNVASVAGLAAFAYQSAYASSKHAVVGLTRSAAAEYAKHGIRINALCPGFTDTPLVRSGQAQNPNFTPEKLAAGVPMGRLATPAEIAQAVLWLTSDASSYMTGQCLALDGGILSR